MNKFYFSRRAAGFSLIEVLIAVVILTLGLLALASLQLSLIRSSADSKAQSLAMSLAKQRLEQLRSFEAVGGTDSGCNSPISGLTNTCYRAITTEADTAVDGDPVAAGTQPIGGVAFSRAVAVQRYVYNKAAGIQQYQLQGTNTALDSTLLTNPITFLASKDFKRVAVTVSWADPSNAPRSVVVEDAIAAFNPADSAAVAKTTKGSTSRPARAVIANPASVAGVIPIAIGGGSDTAATNPRPVIVSQGNNSTVVETRFDIFTYAAISGTSAEAQSRVETSVVGCKCSKTAATQVGNRPTYWDGYKYTTPTTASGIPVSIQATGNSIVQSELCTSCCRDHHDPGSVAGAKFDPRRSTHSHYLSSDLSNAVSAAGTYDEACRLIRVDGVFRVAADTYDDDLILLPTAGLTSASPTTTVANAVPATGSGSASAQYQAFVLDYLNVRFASSNNKTVYNTPVDPTARTNYTALQSPTVVGVTNVGTGNVPKYLHARGLYIDFMETEVRDIVSSAYDNCPVGTPKSDCILKFLPFTSINITELANWRSTIDTKLGISNNGFPLTIDDPLPVRGSATLKNSATAGDTGNGVAVMQRSSSGLAVANDVFPSSALYHVNVPVTDFQNFLVGTVSYSNPNGDYFNVTLTGANLLSTLTVASPADVRFSMGSSATCNANPSTQFTTYKCIPNIGDSLPNGVVVNVGNFNRDLVVNVQNPCTNNNDVAPMPYKKVFDPTSASYGISNSPATVTTQNNNATGNIAANGEYTVATITTPQLATTNTVTVNYGSPTYFCPSNWATFINDNGTEKTLTNAQKTANCSGNGNKDPNFGTTLGACPTGFSPFNGL